MEARWRIELFGELRAVQEGRVITHFRTRKSGLLLACLALGDGGEGRRHCGRPRDELVDLLWPADPPEAGRASFRNALSLLRQVLEPAGVPRGSVLITDRASVQLNPEVVTTDVAEFEAAVQLAARAGHPDERARRLTQAVELYRGELLAGDDDTWVLWERARLAERYFQALGQLLIHLEEAGDLARALDYARQGASLDPLHEETHCALMRLYAALGQPAAIRRQYRELAALLAQHLGSVPAPETEILLASLLDDREHAAARAPAVSGTTASAPLRPATMRRGRAPDDGLPLAASLPQPSTRFFGRSHEIARLRTLLLHQPGTRMVTLIGPGGCGKTRLAIEVARGLRAPWEEAVTFVPLQDVGAVPGILDKLLESLRLSRSPYVPPLDQVASALSHQPVLLVLDNLEHLLPEGAAVVQELLERVAELTLLVTSRQRLGVPGEQLFPVPSLTSEPSVALFLDRARAVREDLPLTEQDREIVEKLCRRLEGLPLSLELAAARADVLTPGQILERVSDRLTLLRRGEGPGPSRHRSLRAALEWSYRLLSPELGRFFARLSVFRGGWTLPAAERVCGGSETEPPIDALERLSQLVARSLVVAEESDGGTAERSEVVMRYRLLEMLREFGAEQLSPAEEAALALRHARYFLARAEEAEAALHTAAETEWLDRLEREHDNFRRALDWAVSVGTGDSAAAELALQLGSALGTFWTFRGYWLEARERMARILALPQNERRTLARAKAFGGLSPIAFHQGDYAAARAMAEEGLAIRRELGDHAGIAQSCQHLGGAARCEGQYEIACALLQESVVIRRELGDGVLIAITLCELGQALRAIGDDAGARSCFAESLALSREAGNPRVMVISLSRAGTQSYLDGDFPTARHHFEEAIEIARRTGYRGYLPAQLYMLGEVVRCEGDEDRAAALYRECLPIWPQIGDRRSLAGTLLGLGHLELQQDRITEANRLFQEGLAISCELESVRDQVVALIGLAGVARAIGHPERAARLLGAVEALCEAQAIRLWPADRREYEREVAGVRAALSREELAPAWVEGRAMPLDTAITEASSTAPRAARSDS